MSTDLTRRHFLGSCCAAVTATGLLSTLAQLRMIGAVTSSDGSRNPQAAATDYKALVCLFLSGGNDANNILIPYDNTSYSAYQSARGALALARDKVLPITPRTTDGRSWALHPSFAADQTAAANGGLKALFDSGKFALLTNVGTLAYPTTKAQYTARSVPLPIQLFSHNDQQVEWQSSIADKAFLTGWGGRVADLTNAFNQNNSISMAISLAGQNSFQVGRTVAQYSVSTSGAISLSGSSTSATSAAGVRTTAMNDLLKAPNDHLFETAFAGITSNAIADSALLSGVLSGNAPFATAFPTTSLGQQLRVIARLIAAAPQLNLKRQIFFARVGGWDLHDDQVAATDTSTGAHANLLADVSRSLKAFYDATAELGVADQVTAFTASDFGRTYNTNGRGSDHGWGSHHLIVGGAVRGGDLYGRMPDLTINGPDDTGRGRWIPTTAVDEYSARLALWFGVSPTDLAVALPNIGRFNHTRPELAFL
ncbi:MAG: DUF1501 domain-containing protein [Opitutae bacterium]|nr:DUF1501 domain-containing protein [Opitutae bacterium]